MSRTLGRIILILGAASRLTSATIVSQQSSAKFEPPDVQNTSDIPYPPNTTVTGLVTLVLSLAESGHVQNVQVVRDTLPLTSAAQSALRTWTFKAARMNGQPLASQLNVNVVFNPYNPGGTEITGLLITPAPTAEGSSSYAPAQITAASYALYPPDSLATCAVVLSLSISRTGQVQKVRLAKDVAALSPAALAAVKSWKYAPATLNGQPISSRLIVAFVFQRNLS
jgi:outer membrane biosynthesis protein TonB